MGDGFLADIDQEARDKIIETHTEVKYIRKELDKKCSDFRSLERRVRRIEQLFLPLVTFVGLVSHKILRWFGL